MELVSRTGEIGGCGAGGQRRGQGQPGGHGEEMRPEEMRAVAWRQWGSGVKDKL